MHILKHFIVITRHRHMVMHYCFKAGLYRQGLLHDLSKYSFVEFFNCAKYCSGTHSPINEEREKKGYSDAWMHHKGRNKHHSEYWFDMNKDTKIYEAKQMPLCYVAEMFCDRLAASKNYNRKNYNKHIPLLYFNKTKDASIMHEKTKEQLLFLLNMYEDNDEKVVFKYIKKNMRNKSFELPK